MTEFPRLRAYGYAACAGRPLGRKPLARPVLGTPLALFRDGAGRPAALLDRCPHRNAPSEHPARNVAAHAAVEQDGLVWVYAGPGLAPASQREKRVTLRL